MTLQEMQYMLHEQEFISQAVVMDVLRSIVDNLVEQQHQDAPIQKVQSVCMDEGRFVRNIVYGDK